MPPNVVDITPPGPGNPPEEDKGTSSIRMPPGPGFGNSTMFSPDQGQTQETNMFKTCMAMMNSAAHMCIGIVVTMALIFSFRGGTPLTATPLHIVLCVTGYQLLMAEAILSLSEFNGWSYHLKLVDKRRAHLILQVLGSGLAIAGSFIKILDKTQHWNSLHGQFALSALVFTSVSLVNGITSLWAFELRKLIPQNLSKLTHICFGTGGFLTACIALCYGFEKASFRMWLGDNVAYALIGITSALCFLTLVMPLFTFTRKFMGIIKR